MDFNTLNGWLLAGVSGCGVVAWWMFRSIHARVGEMEKKQADFELYSAKNYVTSTALEKALDNLNDTIKAVFSKLERIDAKLDKKVDKP